MKNQNVAELIKTIDVVLEKSKKIKLNFLLLENQKLLEDYNETLKKTITFSDMLIDFEKERINLCEEYAEKDEDGNPKTEDNKYVGLLGNEEYKKKYKELEEKYKKEIDEYNKQVKEYEDLLNDTCDVEFKKINVDLIPDDLLLGKELKILTPLLWSND